MDAIFYKLMYQIYKILSDYILLTNTITMINRKYFKQYFI